MFRVLLITLLMPCSTQKYYVEIDYEGWLAGYSESDTEPDEEPIFTPEIDGVWTRPPDIEICKDLPVRIAGKIVRELDWWSLNVSSDYTYGEIYRSACKDEALPGVMRFTRADKKTLKITGWSAYATINQKDGAFDGPVDISSSIVYLAKDNDSWIIRHEIGHGFGWGHTPASQRGHLMNTYVGTRTVGLNEYKAAIKKEVTNE